MNLFINRNKLTDIENKLMVTKGDREGGIKKKKKRNSAICSNMDRPGDYHTK